MIYPTAGDDAAPRDPGTMQFSVGFDIRREQPADVQGVQSRSTTALDFPTPYFGVFFPVMDRLMFGANGEISYFKAGDASAREIDLQPRLEYNFNPDFRTTRSVRLGAHFNWENQSFDTGISDQSVSILGFGGDVGMTFPCVLGLLFRAAFGLDQMLENKKENVPSRRIYSLKFGMDVGL